jgi:hypothetical protein
MEEYILSDSELIGSVKCSCYVAGRQRVTVSLLLTYLTILMVFLHEDGPIEIMRVFQEPFAEFVLVFKLTS